MPLAPAMKFAGSGLNEVAVTLRPLGIEAGYTSGRRGLLPANRSTGTIGNDDMTTFTWTGAAYSFDWKDPDNWDQKKNFPGAKDDVVVATAQTSYDKPDPHGATVRRLELHGGGLQGQLTVKEEVVWTNGHLDQGLDVKGEAEVVISGFALKMLGGPLRLPRGRIEGASIGLYNGATVTVDGPVECSGENPDVDFGQTRQFSSGW